MKLLGINIPEIGADSKVLDLGCGLGWQIKKAAESGARGFGMDISSDQLSRAKNILQDSLEESSFLLQGSASQLPFKTESFDLMICCETVEHVKDPELLLREVHRALKPQGAVILSFPVKKVEKMISFFCGHFLEFSGHVRQFSLSEMKKILEDTGFETVQVHRRYFEWAFYYFWMAVFKAIPKIDQRGNQYGVSVKQEKLESFYKRVWNKLIRWKIGYLLLWIGNALFPKSYLILVRKHNGVS